MRILIVHNSLNDSTSISGVLKHYALLAGEWHAAGHPTDFVVAKAGFPQLRQLAPHARLISSDNFFNATKHLAQTWRYFPAYAWRLATAHLLRLPDHYDVIYASGPFIVEFYAARVLARRQQAKLAVKIQHVLYSQPKRQGWINRLFLWAERVSIRSIHRHAHGVLCLSQVVAQDYRALETELGLTPTTTQLVGCGIDFAAIASVPPSEKIFDVVFLGRLHEQKGVFDLPQFWQGVIAQKPDARLLIIGEGPHRRQTEAMFQQLGLPGSVTFTGGISEDQKNGLLAQSRVGVSLSYEEGWGLSVTEFLAAGLPVAAYDLPVFAQVFPGQLRLVPPRDWPGLAREVTGLLRDETRQRELGRAGREFVRRYDYRQVAKDELAALESVVGPP